MEKDTYVVWTVWEQVALRGPARDGATGVEVGREQTSMSQRLVFSVLICK